MNAIYQVQIDTARDGSYAADITADVLRLAWRLGFDAPHDTLAAPSRAQITVRGLAGQYAPENPASVLQTGLRMRIQATHDGTTVTLFTGWIERVEPQPGEHGPRTAIIHLEGGERFLRHTRVRLPPQVQVRAGDVVAAVLDFAPALARVLEPGLTLLTYAADTWADGIPALDALRQMAEADRGRFFIDRLGRAVFYNRHHTLLDQTPRATFADDADALHYVYGAEQASRVRVRLRPRAVMAAGMVLWRVANAQTVPGGALREIVARFSDDQGRPAGALQVIAPRPGIDYQANTRPDGSGDDLTGHIGVTLHQVDFSAAVLRLHNPLPQMAYIQPGMQLVGTPVYGGDLITLEQADASAEALYGPRVVAFDLPALDSIEEADNLARYELARRRQPQGAARSLSVSGRGHLAQALARTLFDRITVSESHTGHHADYFIVAEAHTVEQGGHDHRVTWTLERANPAVFWLLGRHRLGRETALAY